MCVIGPKTIFTRLESNVEKSMGLVKILIYLVIIVGFFVFITTLLIEGGEPVVDHNHIL